VVGAIFAVAAATIGVSLLRTRMQPGGARDAESAPGTRTAAEAT
jgi:hypothetical protein